jgi:hypothetical protein
MEKENTDNKFVNLLKKYWWTIPIGCLALFLISIIVTDVFKLLNQTFGFLDAVTTSVQSVFSGTPGKCLAKSPSGYKCGDKNKYSGVECCLGLDTDDNQIEGVSGSGICSRDPDKRGYANMTCDTDNSVCCGCSNSADICPNRKSTIDKWLGWTLGVFSGAVLLSVVGKYITGRSSVDAAKLNSEAERIIEAKKAAIFTQKEAEQALRNSDASIRSELNEEQTKTVKNEQINREKAVAAHNEHISANKNFEEITEKEGVTEEELKEAKEAEKEAQEREIEAKERAKPVIFEK